MENTPQPINPEKEKVNPAPITPTGATPTPELKPAAPEKIIPTVTKEPVAVNPIPTIITAAATEPIDRRTFIKWGAIGWAAFAAIVGGYATMIMRYLFPNVLFEPVQTFRAGVPQDYQVGEVSERWKDKYGVWVVRDSEKIYALSTVCTHLGCTPNWLPNDSKFKCPCHGSGFYKTGINFEGPAPRPLERFKISLTDSGEIMIDKTIKFQQEKGEWKNSDSFLLA